jgi:hypothetical protein
VPIIITGYNGASYRKWQIQQTFLLETNPKRNSFPCTNLGTEAPRNFARLTENVNYSLTFLKSFISTTKDTYLRRTHLYFLCNHSVHCAHVSAVAFLHHCNQICLSETDAYVRTRFQTEGLDLLCTLRSVQFMQYIKLSRYTPRRCLGGEKI